MTDAAGVNRTDAAGEAAPAGERGFHRSVGLLPATAINMTQMVGIGPFITIPLMVATFAATGDRGLGRRRLAGGVRRPSTTRTARSPAGS
jgi:hypothetical protein